MDAVIRAQYDERVAVPTMMSEKRALLDLRYIEHGCERMRRLDFGNDDDAVRERMALRLEWDDAIGQLPKIVEAYEHGRLSETTIAEMRRVAQGVAARFPEITRIRFPLPDVEALARALRDAPARTA
jgi:hypothetical protein